MREKLEKVLELYDAALVLNQKYLNHIDEIRDINGIYKNYTQAAKSEKEAALTVTYREQMDAILLEIVDTLTEAKRLEKTELDLSDSGLVNAVQLLKELGADIPGKSLKSITNAYKGNQPALAIIKAACDSADITNVYLDGIMYDERSFYNQIAEMIHSNFMQHKMSSGEVQEQINSWIATITNTSAEVDPVVIDNTRTFF